MAQTFNTLSASTLAWALLLAGCSSVGPDYRAPDQALAAHWRNAGEAGRPAAPAALGRWWQQFGDARLNTLIDTALADNPGLLSAQARLRQARARRGLQAVQDLPQLDGGLSAARQGSHGELSSGSTHSFNASLDASWEIDLFGGQRRALEAAEANLAASQADLDATRVSLVAEIASNYFSLRSNQTRLAVARASLESREKTLQLTRWRHEARLVTPLEVNQAQSSLEQVRASIPLLQQNIEALRLALAVLLGRDVQALDALLPETPAALPDTPAALPDTPAQLAAGIPADTLRQRPDVRAAERRLAAQTAQIGVAEAARYPAFKLSGQIGIEALTPAGLLRADTLSNSVLGSLGAPLLDAGRLRRTVDIQTALRDEALQTYRSSVLQALADVEKALSAWRLGQQRLRYLQGAAGSAGEAARLALIRYQAGSIDLLSVLDTQRTQLSQDDALASARGEQLLNVVQLYKALGGGWQSEPGTPPTPATAQP
ncbi:efflux transporter outer membrane subunit [Uliginosibacterium sediminicola]